MQSIPLEHGLIFSLALFCIGLAGLISRRSIIFSLISIDIMLNAAASAFAFASNRWQQADGQVMFLFIVAIAAAEMALGLALVICQDRLFGSLDTAVLRSLRGNRKT